MFFIYFIGTSNGFVEGICEGASVIVVDEILFVCYLSVLGYVVLGGIYIRV